VHPEGLIVTKKSTGKATCADADVKTVKAQAADMIKKAEKRIAAGPFEHCRAKVESAKAVVAGAAKIRGQLKQRDAYISAAYHAGQAQACAYDPGDPGKNVIRARARYAQAQTPEGKAAALVRKEKREAKAAAAYERGEG
jgi:hypothetical protein